MYNNLTINQSVKPLDMLWCIPRCLLTHLPGVKVSPHRAQFSYSPWLAWTALDWRGVWCKIKGDNDNAWWCKLVNIILFSSSPDESPCSSGSESGEGEYTARQKVKYRWEKQNNFQNYIKKKLQAGLYFWAGRWAATCKVWGEERWCSWTRWQEKIKILCGNY